MSSMVTTFVLRDGVLTALGTAATLGEASAALPDGAYTTLRTYGGDRIACLAQHVQRLEDSARAQGRAGVLDEVAVRSAIAHALRSTALPESRLRLTFCPPDLFVTVEAFAPLPDSSYLEGVACATVPGARERPHAKDTRFLGAAQSAFGALPPGVHERLLVAPDGSVLEGLSSNFFAVRDGVLHTEHERALPGVTRSLVLELAKDVLPRATGALRADQLAEASECFITSVSRDVLPVVRIDGRAIGAGVPGRVTLELLARFRAAVVREAEHVLGPPGEGRGTKV